MTYEGLIELINQECERRGISVYRLSKLSSIPTSTLYGVLRQKNKAQMDTLCEILSVLGLRLVIEPIEPDKTEDSETEENCRNLTLGLSKEKRDVLQKLSEWLRD